MEQALLEVKGITKYFGGLKALKDVNFNVKKGEIFGLIGPNGSGKTTLYNVINGYYSPNSGRIKFKGEDITGLKPYTICKKGIARTFQLVSPFSKQTVLRNVIAGALFGKNRKINIQSAQQEARELLEFVGLSEKRNFLAGELTAPDLKRLEIARALATRPDLLLLDEIAAGLNPVETEEMMNLIRSIRDGGTTVFIIEHVMKMVMGVSDRIMVICYGEKLAEGTPKEVSLDEAVIEAYLGEEHVKSK